MTDTELRELERSIRTNARVTTGLVVATLAVVIAAGAYGYWKAKRVLRPENVAAEAEQYVQAHYPEWRAELKQEMVQQAPRVAERFSQRTLSSIPDARVRVERRLERWTDRGLEQVQDVSTDQLREFVRRHKADIRAAYAEAKQTPEESRAAVNRLEQQIRKEYEVDTQEQARQALAWVQSFNERLREIAQASDPATDAERAERRVARLLRAMESRDPRVANRSTAGR